MILRQRFTYISRSELTLTAASFPAQTVKVQLDRTWPLEEIIVIVNATVNAVIPATAGRNTQFGPLSILKRVDLTVNDGIQPRSVINASGQGLLQYALNTGLNLDRSTRALLPQVFAGTIVAIPASSVLKIAYRIPMVHPQITDALRTRMLLPIHNHPQDPILTLDFAAAADMSNQTNPFSSVVAEVVLVRREMPAALNKQLLDTGGFIPFDLIETQNSLGLGLSNVEQRFRLPLPGQYSGLQIYHMKGNATDTDLDCGDLSGDTTYATATRWRLESGLVVFRDWRMRQLQTLNDFSSAPAGPGSVDYTLAVWAANATYPSNFGGGFSTGRFVQDPGSVFLDFMSDGVNDVNELGSLLDCNLPANSGLQMEIIGNVTTAATNPSYVNYLGHRLFGDLSRWQAIKAA